MTCEREFFPNRPDAARHAAMRERPAGRVVMKQAWRNLLFLHWRYDPVEVQRLLPEGLTVDTYDGAAWVGIVPFFMCDVRPVYAPAVPGLSNFLELNVRTYVYDAGGNPGVWFFSLDASNPIAVWIARSFFKLPYYHAQMRARATPASVDYWSQRKGLEVDHFAWQPFGTSHQAEPESLEYFLVERYRLYSTDPGRKSLHHGQVHHRPYELQEVKVLEWGTQLLAPAGLSARDTPFDHAICAADVKVDIHPLIRNAG